MCTAGLVICETIASRPRVSPAIRAVRSKDLRRRNCRVQNDTRTLQSAQYPPIFIKGAGVTDTTNPPQTK
jgi:hypothetical protein